MPSEPNRALGLRKDLDIVAGWVDPASSVLDLGCGDGDLLAHLMSEKRVHGYGLEVQAEGITACIGKGVNVIEHDLDHGLERFSDASFDLVLMTQTLQQVRRPHVVLQEMLRIGRQCIVTFPNFAHWRCRLNLVTSGRMPISKQLPHRWYDTPNIHLCTFVDFEQLVRDLGFRIVRRLVTGEDYETRPLCNSFPNMFGAIAFYQLTRG